MEILDVKWFGSVGIVRVKTTTEEIKYYIKEIDGRNEEIDKKEISIWGSYFPKDAGDILFGAAPCMAYDQHLFYGNREALTFLGQVLNQYQMSGVRKSAKL